MENLEHLLVVDEEVEERRQVYAFRLGVDRRGLLLIADLDKAQIGPIGVLAHEFGVDRDEWGFGEALAKGKQRHAVGASRMNKTRHGLSEGRLPGQSLVSQEKRPPTFSPH